VFRYLRRWLAVAALSWPLIAAKKPVTIDALLDTPSNHHGPIVWAPDEGRFIVTERGTLSLYDVRTGKDREVIALDKLDHSAVKPSEPLVFDWTNRRVGENDVQWFADGKRLLVAASGDLFIVDIAKGRFDALTETSDFERDPKLSPDNRYVSFRRGADLYVIEIASKVVTRLTSNGSETLLNGQLDWVYPEELDLGTAHWWSPDSRSIAYLQFDVAREPVFPQVSLLNARGRLEPERYPKPGDPNAEVRLGVVPVTGGETKWMDLGEPRGFLIARVVWAPSSREILAERLTRVQNKLELLMANVATGVSRVVLHEEDPAWINVSGEPRFLTGDRFLWTSERSGFRHLYVCDTSGAMPKQLTSGEWEVEDVVGVDAEHQRVYYTSSQDSPLERQLYSVPLAGGTPQRLTKAAGTHVISLAPNAAYYLDDYSSLTSPPESRLYRFDGKEERVFREADRQAADEYEILPTELVKVKASDGTLLYARMIKPAGFQAGKKYPAVVMVYGGPGVQTIHDSWEGLSWDQVLAQKGYVIWQLDNRGSSGRGHAFEAAVYHNMGAHELKDQTEGIQYLISQGFVDARRIGLYGWSYGGYMTLYTITHAPDLIQAAIAGAPVTNWRNYDTIYTERYMGLPEENEEGYRVSAPALNAAAMNGTKLLILHNLEDDNVHFQNSLQMADALEKAGKQFSMVVYPQRSHHVSGPAYKQLLETTTAFFEENLRAQ
jgi:dipeptidyl-peptidase-4